ncbi:hypothetical protein DXK94_15045 [Arthrobacter sp. RT-1]|nr:hypothetical protein DXK94_15045 [Arthrobacter sp. RT-1]
MVRAEGAPLASDHWVSHSAWSWRRRSSPGPAVAAPAPAPASAVAAPAPAVAAPAPASAVAAPAPAVPAGEAAEEPEPVRSGRGASTEADVSVGSSAVTGAAGSAGRPKPAAVGIPVVPAASADAAALPPERAPSVRVPRSLRATSAWPASPRAAGDFLAFSLHQTTPTSTASRMIKKTASMASPSVGRQGPLPRRYVGSTSLSSTLTGPDVPPGVPPTATSRAANHGGIPGLESGRPGDLRHSNWSARRSASHYAR